MNEVEKRDTPPAPMHLVRRPEGPAAQAERASPPRVGLRRRLVQAALLLFLVLVGREVYHVILGSNFHTVIPGRCFRAGQPSASSLEEMVRRYEIKTVINLRGRNKDNEKESWFRDEVQAADHLHVRLVHILMSGTFKPEEQELRKLIDALDAAEEPILLHCNQGGDRTGFASACFLLLKTDATLAQARAQLSLRFGHNPWGSARCQTQMLDDYAAWLAAKGLAHAPEHLRTWVRTVYVKDDWPK